MLKTINKKILFSFKGCIEKWINKFMGTLKVTLCNAKIQSANIFTLSMMSGKNSAKYYVQ